MSPASSSFWRWRSQSGGIDFETDLTAPARESEVIFIAVGTPPLPSGESNLAYLEAAARGIGAAMDSSRYRVVINKSTVPVGSGNLVGALISEGVPDTPGIGKIEFSVASNPEFLREGSAIHDSLYPDRIVIGTEDRPIARRAARIVQAACGTEVRCAAVRAPPEPCTRPRRW